MPFYQQKYFKPYRKIALELYPNDGKYINKSKMDSMRQDSPVMYSQQSYAPTFERSNNRHVRPEATETEPIWEHLYNKGIQSQKKLLEKHQNSRNKIDIQCTFQPVIKTNRRYLATSSSSFLERASVWQQNKIEKMVKQKQEQVNRDLRECTFAPQINDKSRKHKEPLLNKSISKLQKSQIGLRQAYKKTNPYYSPIKISNKSKRQNLSPSPLKQRNGNDMNMAKKMIHSELKKMII